MAYKFLKSFMYATYKGCFLSQKLKNLDFKILCLLKCEKKQEITKQNDSELFPKDECYNVTWSTTC